MVEMQVAGIALDAASRSPIVLLRDPSGRRQVPIWIDQAQAQNILAGLNADPPPRPLSHDLMVALLKAGGLQLDRVIIHAIEASTFQAVLKLSPAGPKDDTAPAKPNTNSIELDARPSDGIALALRTGSPIWMLEADADEQANFRQFLDQTSPADLVRHLSKAKPEADSAPDHGEASPGDH
uniref:bifunctional nuclease family protein n=1 Tax=Cyanobium sp. TaxID=2164130 RepID=UPI0040485354